MLCRNGRKKATIEKKREKMRRINLCAYENSYNNIVVACHNIKTKQIELERERERQQLVSVGQSCKLQNDISFIWFSYRDTQINTPRRTHSTTTEWKLTERKKSDAVKIPSIPWNRNDAVYRFSHAHTPNSMCVCVCSFVFIRSLSILHIFWTYLSGVVFNLILYTWIYCCELFSISIAMWYYFGLPMDLNPSNNVMLHITSIQWENDFSVLWPHVHTSVPSWSEAQMMLKLKKPFFEPKIEIR